VISASATPDLVAVGKVTGVWGVRGWIKISSYTEPAEGVFDYQPWILRRGAEHTLVAVTEGKRHGNGLVARIEGTDNREEAMRWVGQSIWVRSEALPKLPQGEYYWRQLVGLKAVTNTGVVLGEVVRILQTGANDVLVIKGDRERLVPYVSQVVLAVDLEQGQIQLDWDPEYE